MSALSPPARPWPRLVSRAPDAYAGASSLIAGAGVAAWSSVDRFDHGWWLASFLVLVGGIAQILLGAGQRALAQPRSGAPARRATARQAALWNAGTLLVPFGVLAHVRLPVVIGGVTLLAALAGLTRDMGRAGAQRARGAGKHRAEFISLVWFLAVSVLVGTALAWDLPWT